MSSLHVTLLKQGSASSCDIAQGWNQEFTLGGAAQLDVYKYGHVYKYIYKPNT